MHKVLKKTLTLLTLLLVTGCSGGSSTTTPTISQADGDGKTYPIQVFSNSTLITQEYVQGLVEQANWQAVNQVKPILGFTIQYNYVTEITSSPSEIIEDHVYQVGNGQAQGWHTNTTAYVDVSQCILQKAFVGSALTKEGMEAATNLPLTGGILQPYAYAYPGSSEDNLHDFYFPANFNLPNPVNVTGYDFMHMISSPFEVTNAND